MIYDEVIQSVVGLGAERLGLNGEIELKRSDVLDHELSTILRLVLCDASLEKTVFVKLSKLGDARNFIMWGPDLAEEYRALSVLQVKLSEKKFLSVARPIAYLAKHQALVTEEIEGKSVHDLFLHETRHFRIPTVDQDITGVAWLSGEWLREFHEVTLADERSFDLEPSIRYVDVRLKKLEEIKAKGIDREFSRNLLKMLDSLRLRIDQDELVIAGCHNDYCPHNLMLSEGRELFVYDFASYGKGPVLFDILRFWNELDGLGQEPLHSRRVASRLQESFLSGYGAAIDMQAPAVKFMLCLYKVSKLLSSSLRGVGRVGALKNGAALYRHDYRWITTKVMSP